ncbi:MAG: hypothetical protein JNJ88_15135 [Planctomycetes bacterium]|nr:hypothetical protein [Planctomycetota bacterium]
MSSPMRWGVALAALCLVTAALYEGVYRRMFCYVWIGPDELGVVVSRVGADLPAGQTLAEKGQRGVQREVLGTGVHFIDPFNETVQKFPLVKVTAGTDAREENGTKIPMKAPEVGVVASLAGTPLPPGEFLANPGQKGIQRKVLTPGVYRINPFEAKVELHPATIIETGFVGVVTHLAGEPAQEEFAEPHQRGVLREPLPPGIYNLNPYEYQVRAIKVGYRELSFAGERAIAFPAADGNTIKIAATVVWGLTPADAPYVAKQFGSEDAIVDNAIRPQVESKARVVGSSFTSRQFVEGESRERFQDELARRLLESVEAQHLRITRALVRDVEVPESVRKPLQASKVAVEESQTNQVKTETAKIFNELSRIRSSVELESAKVRFETEKLVQEEMARGDAEVAKLHAETKSQIAQRQLEASQLRAESKKVLGRAEIDVATMMAEAESDGLRRMVEPFGSSEVYALWRFASGLPDSLQIQLRYAGPGTLWTDLPEAAKATLSKN